MASAPLPSEQTPLLQNDSQETNEVLSPRPASLQSAASQKKHTRAPTVIALSLLSVVIVAILCLGFAVPQIVEEYAKEALVVEPDRLSIDSFTATGVRARVQATFYLDASRVRRKSIRDLGRLSTWIAKEVVGGPSHLEVTLPEYDDVLLGTAEIPPVKVNIRNQHENHVNFLTDLKPGNLDGIRTVAKDWLDGKLKSIDLEAIADVTLKSGIFSLGQQSIRQDLRFAGDQVPTFPDIDIQRLKFQEYGPPGKPEGMKAMAEVSLMNDYPVQFEVPPLSFDVLLPDCYDNYLTLGNARTEVAKILPKQLVNVSVTGLIKQLPTQLTTACPGTSLSPLDGILGRYLKGEETTVYVRGSDQDLRTPDWMTELLRGTVLPMPLPGHPFDKLIKNFSLANVHFNLPDPTAEPDTPESQPRISATVKALIGLPHEMNFNLDVDKVKADADIFYKGDKLGKLDLNRWQPARTSKVGKDLLIESDVNNAPLTVTDTDVFAEVVQKMLFGKGVILDIHADVDVNAATVLGEFVIRRIPAKGKIFIKSLGGGFFPKVGGFDVVDTTGSSITLSASVNVNNPTAYSAHVPYVNISISTNETLIGYASTETDVVPGMNDVVVKARVETNGIGKELLSQILSGMNTTLQFSTHEGSIPSQPKLGEALSGVKLEMDTPKLFGKFLKEATVRGVLVVGLC